MPDQDTKPLRILVAHNVSSARNGGMSRLMGFVHDVLESRGHEVEYLCAEALPARLSGPIARLGFPLLVHRWTAAVARKGRPYDIVNVHEPSSAVVGFWRAAAGNPVVVVTSYGVELRAWEQALAERRAGRGGPSLKTRLIHPATSLWQSRLGLRWADHILCSSSEDRDYLVERLGCPDAKITRIFSGADSIYARLSENRDYTRCRQVLFAGSWIRRKGVEEIARAFALLATRYPELTLTVLGAGVPEAVVRSAFPASAQSRIRYVQAESETETAATHARADIFLLPSHFEGTPLTLVEAMMSGLPIVTTATCGMKDVIRDGENGILIRPYSVEDIVSAIERLIGSAELRARIGPSALADALGKYTWSKVAAPVEEVYSRLCARRRAGGRA